MAPSTNQQPNNLTMIRIKREFPIFSTHVPPFRHCLLIWILEGPALSAPSSCPCFMKFYTVWGSFKNVRMGSTSALIHYLTLHCPLFTKREMASLKTKFLLPCTFDILFYDIVMKINVNL